MNHAPAAPWRRLAPLAVAVVGVHALLLDPEWRDLAPSRSDPVRFVTRTVTPPAPAKAMPAPPAAARPGPRAVPSQEPPTSSPQRAPEVAPPPGPAPAAAARVEGSAPASGQPMDPLSTMAPLPTPVLGLPEPARMHYEVVLNARGFNLQGEARLDWRHDGKQYEATLEIASPGLRNRVQRSTGRITEHGLEPSYFSDKARNEQATHFDREQGRLVFSNNRPAATLVEGMQDRLSVVVQLSMLVAGQPATFTPGTQVTLPTVGTREPENWTFSVEGEEELQLPGGTLRALKLQRLPRKEYDQKVELWLAPGMDYAPVRLRLTNPNGDGVDQRWSSTDRG